MLKPLPQENPNNNAQSTHPKRAQKTHQTGATNSTHLIRLEVELRELEKTDHHLFSAASKQLMEYIKKAENITMHELNQLIHNLQRTVLGLQKKRLRIVRREQRKKKNNL